MTFRSFSVLLAVSLPFISGDWSPVRAQEALPALIRLMSSDSVRAAATTAAAITRANGSFQKPYSPFTAPALALRDSVVSVARRQVGLPYRFGATTPASGFDCSGLVKYVMAAVGQPVPRTSREQARFGTPVVRQIGALKPGDLLFFGKDRGISHVGIFVGNGRYVHAVNRRNGVKEMALRDSDWWKSARRILPND